MAALPFCHLRLRSPKPDGRYPVQLQRLGDHIRKRRLDLGLLQRDVALQLGVNVKTVTNWEKQRTEPETRFLLRFSASWAKIRDPFPRPSLSIFEPFGLPWGSARRHWRGGSGSIRALSRDGKQGGGGRERYSRNFSRTRYCDVLRRPTFRRSRPWASERDNPARQMPSGHATPRAPLSDAVVTALARLVDDSQSETREPSHSDLEFLFTRAGLNAGDPKTQGQTVGKAKRVRATLSWAIEHQYAAGETLVASIVAQVRGCGGFRPTSRNFVGAEAVLNLAEAFGSEGYELAESGELRPRVLDSLSGQALSDALASYVRRAKRGIPDGALVVGTGKDLVEATAAHILVERFGAYPSHSNFPTLLGQAFAALALPTPQDPQKSGEPPQSRLSRALFEAGCAVNNLRNKEGTGHGHPWTAGVTDEQARTAVEVMGVLSEFLLETHRSRP
jgi:DNA-binding XRE family transcriptional regulator